ncbi:unnamed protein product [Phyllotreta striolata]|uniref:cellulase n=1 Tax=Phyllotreta striolata TaxID=444603 RepID=A0A9N9TGM1_PHYSR|nr:unnamed protein product [Phyllotreta striolata]
MHSFTILLSIIATYLVYSNGEITIKKITGGVSGTGNSSRYWDCCKPTCSWPGNVQYKQPVKACKADGKTPNDPENQSGCIGGQSYTCTQQHCYSKNDTLAYGFVAAQFNGAMTKGRNMCCACVLLTFHTYWPSTLNGKQLLAQVTNTGNDDPDPKDNLFDIAMPGSGVGYYDKGCTTQWNTTEEIWGNQYGGLDHERDCYNLPEPLVDGCLFRFQWMAAYSNPDVSFEEVECPRELLDISGCPPVSPP